MEQYAKQAVSQLFLPIITGAIGGYLANEMTGYFKKFTMSPKTELMLYIFVGIAVAYFVNWLIYLYKKNREEDRSYTRIQIEQMLKDLKREQNFTNRQIEELRTQLNK